MGMKLLCKSSSLVEVKYCENIRLKNQLKASKQQHCDLLHHLSRASAQVTPPYHTKPLRVIPTFRIDQGYGKYRYPIYTQEDCVESDSCASLLVCAVHFSIIVVRSLAGHQASYIHSTGFEYSIHEVA
eukprot:1161195-Pelagomonas_calceolata.AAC.23